jgi:hypothetical protein
MTHKSILFTFFGVIHLLILLNCNAEQSFEQNTTTEAPSAGGTKYEEYFITQNYECVLPHRRISNYYEITSPNYPLNYEDNMNCNFTISNPNRHKLIFQFVDLQMENCTSCVCDHVSLLNMEFIHEDHMIKLCSFYGEKIYAWNPSIRIHFKTDSSIVLKGFLLKYWFDDNESTEIPNDFTTEEAKEVGTTVPTTNTFYPDYFTTGKQECSLSHRRMSNYYEITSPNYPSNYDNNMNCSLTITNPYQRKLMFEFIEIKMELCGNCVCDHVSIWNVEFGYESLLEKLCGIYGENLTFFSTSSSVRVHFETDYSNVNKGFLLKYWFTDNESTDIPNVITTLPTANTFYPDYFTTGKQECSLSHRRMSNYYEITSPNYPSNYDNNMHCNFTISNPYRRRLIIEFPIDIEMERCGNCVCDYVSIWNVESGYEILLGKLCGIHGENLKFPSFSPIVRVQFETDHTVVNKGFLLKYWFADDNGSTDRPIVPTTMPWVFTTRSYPDITTSGPNNNEGCILPVQHEKRFLNITSPNYPNQYQPNLNCSITINNLSGRDLFFQIVDLDIENSQNCTKDKVSIYDDKNLIDSYCGKKMIDKILVTSSPSVHIYFTTDDFGSGSGFQLKFWLLY